MTLKSRPILLALMLSAAMAAPAFAQLDPLTTNVGKAADERSDKRLDRMEKTVRELRSIVMQGKDTGKPVVVQPAETQGQIDLLSQKVGDLDGALRRVNSGLDNLTTDIAAMRRENAQLAANGQALAAANARIDALERQLTALTAAAVAARPPPAPAASADPGVDFDRAMRLYTDGQFRAAASAFQTYLDAHGDADDAREANYYLGEAKYRQGDYQGASIGYIGAIRGWPTTTWAPDATVKLALSLVEVRKADQACQVLQEFISRYPKAGASVKASATQAKTRARCT